MILTFLFGCEQFSHSYLICWGNFAVYSSLAFPLGGRWPEGPDEGAMMEFLRSSGGFRRRGTRQGRTSFAMTAYPRSPITWDAYLLDFTAFPARKI